MTNNPNSINSIESNTNSSKSSKFVENTKRAVRNVLVKTWIAASTMTPMATTTTSTVIPASVNTITAIAPLASTAVKTISLWTAAGLLAACSKDEPDGPNNPEKSTEKDTTPPTIEISKSEVDITWWKQVRIDWNQLYIWDVLVASWSDNKSTTCNVTLSLNWKAITSWTTISEEWTLSIKVSDAAGNSKNADINLKVTIDQDIIWLENLQNLNMQVDQEVNILNWITFGNWTELVKVEIELDGEKTEISDPNHYIPAYPWTCSIILSVKGKDGKLTEYKVDNLSIKALEYKAMEVNNIRPVDILPIIWQIEVWDKKVYEHIEHLRVAEATRIRDMMREYGAGNHSAEEYKQLMNRLNTGMTRESPSWYDNYNIIWWEIIGNPSSHARCLRSILNTLINHAKFRIDNPLNDRASELSKFIKNNPNSINIFWNSTYSSANNKSDYNELIYSESIKNLCNLDNCLIFAAGTNINKKDWHLRNKIFNWEYEWDEYGWYSLASMSNSDKNTRPNTHLLVTIATNKDGDIDQTDITTESSKYPIWFANNVLFSGRGFPQNRDEKIYWPSWRYTTSDTNYLNVALADLCFQMFAEVKDVDRLLEMIRSTCLTDYIKLDWQTQELQLMNPAWFFQKYLMPTDIPSSLQSSETISLNKWYYKWVIFDIPWAEVKINWEWIVYNDTNKSKIKSQNPMTLEWRLNWDLCRKLWYKWKSLNWKFSVVDDKWNGLNIDKDFSISIQ